MPVCDRCERLPALDKLVDRRLSCVLNVREAPASAEMLIEVIYHRRTKPDGLWLSPVDSHDVSVVVDRLRVPVFVFSNVDSVLGGLF